jgi:tetratricopeptide (TPR) repeat protein
MGTRRINPSVARTILLIAILQPVLAAQPATQPDPAFDAVYKVWAGGSQRAAERMFPQLIQDNPQNVRLQFFQGICARIRYGAPSGKLQLQNVLVTAPDSPEGQCSRILLALNGAADKAGQVKILQQFADAHSDDPLILCVVAYEASDMEDHELPLTYCQKLSQMMDPGPPQLHHLWAGSLDGLNRSDEALVHRRLALKLEEGAWSHGGLAYTLMRLQRYDEASSEYAKAVAIYPAVEHYEGWAYSLYYAHRYEEAIDKCEKANQADPQRVLTLSLCGDCLAELGRNDEALDKFAKAIKVEPDDPRVYRRAAALLRAIGRNEEAAGIERQWIAAGNKTPLGSTTARSRE